MSRALIGDHVMYVRSAQFLSVIISSLRTLCFLPSVMKQKYDFHIFAECIIKTIIKFSFCAIQNDQGLGEGTWEQGVLSQMPFFDLLYNSLSASAFCFS